MSAFESEVAVVVGTTGGGPSTGRRGQDLTTLHGLFRALERRDIAAFTERLAEHARYEMPFGEPGAAGDLDGRAAIRAAFDQIPVLFSSVEIRDLEIFPTTISGTYFAEFRGVFTLSRPGAPYDSTYLMKFELADGRVTLLREYLNPIKRAEAFSGPDTRTRNVATVQQYFRLQEAQDLDTWITLWAENGAQAIPYAPAGFPEMVAGRDRLEGIYRGLFAGYAELSIRDLRIDPQQDPNRVLARWHTHAELTGGGTYDNDLIGLFEFDDDGKLNLLTEYFNPVAFGRATADVQ